MRKWLRRMAPILGLTSLLAVSAVGVLADPSEETKEAEPQILVSEFTDETYGTYELQIKDGSATSLEAAVWSEEGGQDDLKWNKLTKEGKDTFTAEFQISDYRSPGKYYVHVYDTLSNGKKEWVTGLSFEVPRTTGGQLELVSQDKAAGTAQVRVSGMDVPAGIAKVRVPVWSTSNQSDIIWYEASQGADGAYYVTMDISKHKGSNWAVYIARAYVMDGNGFQTYVGGTRVDFSLEAKTPQVTVDEAANTYTIQVEDPAAPGGIAGMSCAVWSDASKQADLKWVSLSYDAAAGVWKAQGSLSHLKHTGTCRAHVYMEKKDGSKAYLGGTSFQLSSPTGQAAITTDAAKGSFQVNITNVKPAGGISKVEAAVWSASNQSDLRWYTASKQSNGNYTLSGNISNHKYHLGQYKVHVYVTDQNGIKTAISCQNMSMAASSDKPVAADRYAGTSGSQETEYRVTLNKVVVPGGAKKVEIAVWSETGGQDDIRWYTASQTSSGTYQADFSIKNHKTAGKYLIHAYATTQGGEKVYLSGSSDLQVKGKPSGSFSVISRNDTSGTFTVKLNLSAPSGITSVRFAAWTTATNGQDMAWYTADRQSDGSYQATVKVINHQYNLGDFTIHAYAVMGNQIQSFALGTHYTFNPSNFLYILTDSGKGRRTAVLKNAVGGDIRFAVWSATNGQDDLVWYTASLKEDGSWRAQIVGSNHKHSGKCYVHAYSGSNIRATSEFEFASDEVAKNGWYYEGGYKFYYVNGVKQTDVSGIIGQQDSYKAEVNRTTCTVTIYAKDGSNGYIIPVKAFTCSVGLPSADTETPVGTFHTLAKYRWATLMGPSYGQYCTRITNTGILFHSVAGSNTTSYNLKASDYNMLGQPASHGCIRLTVRDAKWIYDNCPLNMEVKIYDSSDPGPFGKPATIKIPETQNWDPTDPAVG